MPRIVIDWEWEEAFDYHGFSDGDGIVMTGDVEEFLESLGWTVETASSIHNTFITRLTKGDVVLEFDNESDPRNVMTLELVKALDVKFPDAGED